MGHNGVIQGSFRGRRLPVLQARATATGVPAKVGPRVAVPRVRFPNQNPAPAQAKPTVATPAKAPPPVLQLRGGEAVQVPATLNLSTPAGGQPLPVPVREKMESFFGTSFADVRVHVSPQAASIGALAFTHGSNLFFAPGQYNPGTAHGQQLLGHELTHVVQQRAGRVKNPFGSGLAVVQDHALEAEADRMGLRAARFTGPIQAKNARDRGVIQAKICSHCGWENGHAPDCTPETREAQRRAQQEANRAQADQSMDNRSRRDQSHPHHGNKNVKRSWKKKGH